jgi:hypothetical protein
LLLQAILGADDRDRTGDLLLTMQVLYLLSYVSATWLRGQDSNLRPPGYEPDELPGCSTPRQSGGGGWIRTTVGFRQQIYSLPPLTTRAPLQSAGAGGGTRTHNLLITNQLLCPLSHASQAECSLARDPRARQCGVGREAGARHGAGGRRRRGGCAKDVGTGAALPDSTAASPPAPPR